jgi:hypothetical protein
MNRGRPNTATEAPTDFPRGIVVRETTRIVTTLRVVTGRSDASRLEHNKPFRWSDAKRPRVRSHAKRGNDGSSALPHEKLELP